MLDARTTKVRDFVTRLRARARDAQSYLERDSAPAAVSAVQEAFEFLAKALCLLTGLQYPKTHVFDPGSMERLLKTVPDQLNAVDSKYADMQTFAENESPMILAELGHALSPDQGMMEEMAAVSNSTVIFGLTRPIDPSYVQRVLFLTNFWGQFYIVAKYGDEVLGAPPSLLVTPREATLAVDHLGEADALIYRLQMKLVETVRNIVADALNPSST